MSGYLLDTNVISELASPSQRNPGPAPRPRKAPTAPGIGHQPLARPPAASLRWIQGNPNPNAGAQRA